MPSNVAVQRVIEDLKAGRISIADFAPAMKIALGTPNKSSNASSSKKPLPRSPLAFGTPVLVRKFLECREKEIWMEEQKGIVIAFNPDSQFCYTVRMSEHYLLGFAPEELKLAPAKVHYWLPNGEPCIGRVR